jgi:hypothetical protein
MMRTRNLGVAILALSALLSVLSPKSGDAAEASYIAAIAPATASYGESVSISGIGFGGPGVVVRVGGVQALVVSATGKRVTFLVPTGVPPGPTTVTATNPGGHMGSIAFDLSGNVTLTLDEDHAVTSLVGLHGGVLTTASNGRTFTLTIPPGALGADEPIVLTPIAKIGGWPLDQLLAAAHFAPEGLQFFKAATLAITLPSGANTHGLIGFAATGNGTNLHLVPPTFTDGTIQITVPHFSAGGAGTGALLALNTVTCQPNSTLECTYTNQLAQAYAQAQQTVCGTDCSTPDDWAGHQDEIVQEWFAPEFAILGEWFGKVLNVLKTTGVANDASLSKAGREYMNWKGWEAGHPCGPSDCSDNNAIIEDEKFGAQALATAYLAALQRAKASCNDSRVADLMVEITQLALFEHGEQGAMLPGSDSEIQDQFACQLDLAASLPETARMGDTVSIDIGVGLRPVGGIGPVEALGGTPVQLKITDGCGTIAGTTATASTGVTDPNGHLTTELHIGPPCNSAHDRITVTVTVDNILDADHIFMAFGKSQDFSVTIPIAITVSPENATVSPGGVVLFTAAVEGLGPLVTWTSSGGTITAGPNATATYTAGATPGIFGVTATSVDDPSQSQTVAVTVQAQGGHFNIEGGFQVSTSATTVGGTKLVNQRSSASLTSTTPPTLPLILSTTSQFVPSDGWPAVTTYAVSAQANGPLPATDNSSGTFTGGVLCSAAGATLTNDEGVFDPQMPKLETAYNGSFSLSVPAGGLSVSVSGVMSRGTGAGRISGSHVVNGYVDIAWVSGGGIRQHVNIPMDNITPTAPTVPFNQALSLAAPGFVSIQWLLSSNCFDTAGNEGLNVRSDSTMSLSYGLSSP